MQLFLHAGSGKKTYEQIPIPLAPPLWKEIRLDIDPAVEPDVVSTLIDMKEIRSESFDALFTSHTVEHLYPQEVQLAMREFCRVLKPDGFAIVTCPDLEYICSLIAQGKLLETMYDSPEGPVTPLDMLYGFRPAIAEGNTYMAHKTGFSLKVLCGSLKAVGFQSVTGMSRARDFDLWAIASKKTLSERELQTLAKNYFPK